MTFTSGANNSENWNALRSHYMDKFSRADNNHLNFMRRHADQLDDCFCGVCDNFFARPVRLLHLFVYTVSQKNCAQLFLQ